MIAEPQEALLWDVTILLAYSFSQPKSLSYRLRLTR